MKKEFSTKFSSQCRSCKSIYEFERTVFVFEEDNTEFILNFSENYNEFKEDKCSHCNCFTYSNIPFGYYSSKYGATIVTIYSCGDYSEFRNSITNSFNIFEKFVSSNIADTIQNSPYIILNGWEGFNNFSRLLLGNEIDFSSNNESDYLLLSDGFYYDKLFFYYVEDKNINPIIQAVLGISAYYRNFGELNQACKLLTSVTDFGIRNCSVLKELGIILLNLNDKEKAKKILQVARKNQHKWLGITLDFIDATPIKRADGESQASHLPHSLPILTLQKFTDIPHTLLRICPGSKDVKVSFFPEMEQIESENAIEVSNCLQILSIVLGEFWFAKKQNGNLYFNFHFHLNNLHQALQVNLSEDISEDDFQNFWYYFAISSVKFNEMLDSKETFENISINLGKFMGFINWERTMGVNHMSEFEIYVSKNLERTIMNIYNNYMIKHSIDKKYEQIMLQGFYCEIAERGGPNIEISFE